jgi:hypothetical protein
MSTFCDVQGKRKLIVSFLETFRRNIKWGFSVNRVSGLRAYRRREAGETFKIMDVVTN